MNLDHRLGFLSLFVLSVVSDVHAQSAPRKPGLWVVTTTMSRPAGGGPGGGPISSSTSTEVCATAEEFDKYGTFKPRMDGSCKLVNIVKQSGAMSATLVCDGKMKGKGTLESSWSDSQHSNSKAHFVGTIQVGANAHPLEWTSESSSVFKGSDCGNVKAVPVQ